MRLAQPRSSLLARRLLRSESSSASISLSTWSLSLYPSGPNSLMPLSAYGLCEAEIITHRARQHADGRRRDRTGEQHVHADRGEAGDQRGLDHVAGQAGVFADQDAMPVLAVLEDQPGGLPDLERQFGGNDFIGPAANAVGAE